jgi:hypothetical protein
MELKWDFNGFEDSFYYLRNRHLCDIRMDQFSKILSKNSKPSLKTKPTHLDAWYVAVRTAIAIYPYLTA